MVSTGPKHVARKRKLRRRARARAHSRDLEVVATRLRLPITRFEYSMQELEAAAASGRPARRSTAFFDPVLNVRVGGLKMPLPTLCLLAEGI